MTGRIVVPAADWATHLPEAIRTAPSGATIAVATEDMRQLGERAAGRMRRGDLAFEVDAQAAREAQ